MLRSALRSGCTTAAESRVYLQGRHIVDASSSTSSSPLRVTVRGKRRGSRFLVSSNMEFQLSASHIAEPLSLDMHSTVSDDRGR